MQLRSLILLVCFFVLMFFGKTSFAQLEKENPKTHLDTLIELLNRKQTFAKDNLALEVLQKKQIELVNAIEDANNEISVFLKQNFNENEVRKDLYKINNQYQLIFDGILFNKGSIQTQRDLTVTLAILYEIRKRLEKEKKSFYGYSSKLYKLKHRLDSLKSVSELYVAAGNELEIEAHLNRINTLTKRTEPINASLTKSSRELGALQADLNFFIYRAKSVGEDIETLRSTTSASNLKKELPYIWEKAENRRPLDEILNISFKKELLAFRYYIEDNWYYFGFLIVLICCSYSFISALKRHVKNEGIFDNSYEGQLILKLPILSACILVISIFQFMLPEPPFVVNTVLWGVSIISLSIIFRNFIVPYWYKFWVIVTILFIGALSSNLILQESRLERLILLFLSFSGVLVGLVFVPSEKTKLLRENLLVYFISIFSAVELISTILNIYGRYNMSKTLMIGGYCALIIGVLFLWTVRLVNEGLVLAGKVYKHPDKSLFYINFNKFGEKAPPVFYVFLVIGWFWLVARNFYRFKMVLVPIDSFLSKTRELGEYSFTVYGLLLFVLILAASVFISKIVSFFASEPLDHHNDQKVGLGSWILLIRISIISLGIFFAFAAAGIPIDRITIIIGALGVGIGLGLQSLVKNLVSGVVISFERSVNVGDVIEINGKTATMRSIGFRSSIVSNYDGSTIIIPNGELLNQNLVNWSRGKNSKLIVIALKLSNCTDLGKTKQIILNVLESRQDLRLGNRDILVKDFDMLSVNLEVYFWCRNFSEASSIKSEISTAILEVLQQNDIKLAYEPLPILNTVQEAKAKPKKGKDFMED